MDPAGVAKSAAGATGPSGVFDPEDYTLVRLDVSNVQHEEVVGRMENLFELLDVPGIEALDGGSWEICVRKACIGDVKDKLHVEFPGSVVDVDYDPLKPTAKESVWWGRETANTLRQSFERRAIKMAKASWTPAAMYYTHVLQAHV